MRKCRNTCGAGDMCHLKPCKKPSAQCYYWLPNDNELARIQTIGAAKAAERAAGKCEKK